MNLRAGDRDAVLVLRALGIGDLLAAVPALRAVRGAFPEHRVVLACPATLEPLARLSGAVDEVLDVRPLAPLPAEANLADLAVNLHGRGPESHRVLLAARPRGLIAFRHPQVPESDCSPFWVAGEHERERWCRLLRESGIPADPSDHGLASPVLPTGFAHLRGATVIHAGAGSRARRWPIERWTVVAGNEAAEGRRVVLTGDARDRPGAVALAGAAGLEPDAVLAGRTGLQELAAVVAHAGLVLSGDTGVSHLAASFGTPSVTLFGPVPPSEWGPPNDGPHVALWHGRRGDPHRDTPDPGLLEITVEEVLDAIAFLRERQTSRAGRGGGS